MKTLAYASVLLCVELLLVSGCSTEPKTVTQRTDLNDQVQTAIAQAKEQDPGITKFFNESVGYAVFPAVGKGAFGVGGAYGRGELYENGALTGYCTMTQASIGPSVGGQAYAEFVFFNDMKALDQFKRSDFTFAAQVSAVVLKSGASANAKYADGVAVFTLSQQGLMLEAAIGGQHFAYEAK